MKIPIHGLLESLGITNLDSDEVDIEEIKKELDKLIDIEKKKTI